MGGWAPYFSLAGIFKSSTKTTTFLPIAGPYTPRFRLKKGIGQRLFNLSRDRGSPSYYKTREQLLVFLPSLLLAMQNARGSRFVGRFEMSRGEVYGGLAFTYLSPARIAQGLILSCGKETLRQKH